MTSDSLEYARIAPLYEALLGRIMRSSRLEVLRLCKAYNLRSLLDIGCGTGEQGAMALSQGIEFIGIDQDLAMLKVARARLPQDTSVQHIVATAFADEILRHKGVVDVALCAFIVHEMDYASRLQLMDEVRLCARHLMLIEYVLPERCLAMPASLVAHIPERLAGKRHYTCFRDVMKRGGVEGFLYETHLPVLTRSTFLGGAVRVVLAKLG